MSSTSQAESEARNHLTRRGKRRPSRRVDRRRGAPRGAAAGVARAGRRASLQLLLVDPDLRPQGIGRRLHDAALEQFAHLGAQSVSLGGALGPYLWPGLPAELAEARAILERWGWTFGYTCWDLVRELADYQMSADVA